MSNKGVNDTLKSYDDDDGGDRRRRRRCFCPSASSDLCEVELVWDTLHIFTRLACSEYKTVFKPPGCCRTQSVLLTLNINNKEQSLNMPQDYFFLFSPRHGSNRLLIVLIWLT